MAAEAADMSTRALDADQAGADQTLGLTTRVIEIITPSWEHGVPVDQVDTLSTEDLASIQRALDGTPNHFWRQLLIIMGYKRVDEKSRQLLQRAATLPAPAAVPGADPEAAAEQARNTITARYAALTALGIQGYQEEGAASTEFLSRFAKSPEESARVVGRAQSRQFSLAAATALAIVAAAPPTAPKTAALAPVINLTSTGTIALNVPIVPPAVDAPATPSPVLTLTESEAQGIQAVANAVKENGLKAFLRGGNLGLSGETSRP
jgi:hypothetical protein